MITNIKILLSTHAYKLSAIITVNTDTHTYIHKYLPFADFYEGKLSRNKVRILSKTTHSKPHIYLSYTST